MLSKRGDLSLPCVPGPSVGRACERLCSRVSHGLFTHCSCRFLDLRACHCAVVVCQFSPDLVRVRLIDDIDIHRGRTLKLVDWEESPSFGFFPKSVYLWGKRASLNRF